MSKKFYSKEDIDIAILERRIKKMKEPSPTIQVTKDGLEPKLEKIMLNLIEKMQIRAHVPGDKMSKKRPCIVQIDRDTHKKLKIISAWQNRSMGGIVIELVKEKYESRVKHRSANLYLSPIKNIGEGVTQNDEK